MKAKLVRKDRSIREKYAENGQVTTDVESINFAIVDEESGNNMGESSISKNCLNLNVHGTTMDIEYMAAGIEKLFNGEEA